VIYFAKLYKRRLAERREKEKEKDKYKSSNLNPQFAEVCIQRLKHMMEIEKVYCDEGLNLQKLAEKLSMKSYQLSQLLNEKLHKNYSDYINFYRIEEAKRMLASSKKTDKNIAAIAHDVGFNSMTAFYKAFKKYTGVKPKEYKNIQ